MPALAAKKEYLPEFPKIPGVVFKNIPGFVGYAVSSDGHVWSCKTTGRAKVAGEWKKRKATPHKINGYVYVHLSVRGKLTLFTVHKLVLEAFVGPRPEKAVACHKDNNPANNAVSNLRWDTHSNNLKDNRPFEERFQPRPD